MPFACHTKNSLICCQQPRSKIYDKSGKAAYIDCMSKALYPLPDYDEDEAELTSLTAAVNKSRANELGVPHAEMREWLLEIAAGNFDAKPPVSRKL
jgi:hypothetical protein